MIKSFREQILLIGIGNVAQEILTHLRSVIESAFNRPCVAGAALIMPEFAYVAQRRQYSAGAILEKLPRGRDGRVLGVVDLDLFVPELNFVFGLADPAGGRAVVALPRLRESFYGSRENQNLFLARAAKEAIHELGHTFGLAHCRDRDCVMAFSNSLQDTDRKGQGFCTRCTTKLRL